jgi:lipopolysaccharide transport system ATP-binding protein
MKDVSEGGRTVLFVSHNMGAIQNLCEKCILLGDGKIQNIGKSNDIVNEYLNTSLNISDTSLVHRNEQKSSEFMFISIGFQDSKGQKLTNLSSGENVNIILDYLCKDNNKLRNVQIAYNITMLGEPLIMLNTEFSENFETIPAKGCVICTIPKLPLTPGYYSIRIRSYSNGIMTNHLADAAMFYVKDGQFFESGLMPKDFDAKFLVDHYWKLEER